jgi:hypothetical protein
VGASAWWREKEERGRAWCGDRQLRAVGNGPRPSGVGSIVAARTGEGVGDADDRVSTTVGRDQGEAGPGGSGQGAREKREIAR